MREYIYPVGPRSVIWLLVSERTDKPVAGGTAGTFETAERAMGRAKAKRSRKRVPPKVTEPLGAATWLIHPQGKPPPPPRKEASA